MVLLSAEHPKERRCQLGVETGRAKLLCLIEEKISDVLRQRGGRRTEKGKRKKPAG